MILDKWWLVDGYEVLPSSYVYVCLSTDPKLLASDVHQLSEQTGAPPKITYGFEPTENADLKPSYYFSIACWIVLPWFNNCAISTGEWGCYSNCFLLLYIYTYDMKISTAINLGEWLLNALCVCNEWTIAISRASRIQWPFQEPKLEVPAIYKAYVLGLCKGISPENMSLYGAVPPF